MSGFCYAKGTSEAILKQLRCPYFFCAKKWFNKYCIIY